MRYITIIVIILIIGLGIFGWSQGWFASETTVKTEDESDTSTTTDDDSETSTTTDDENNDASGESTNPRVIGSSVEGRDIEAYKYGSGGDEILFVGGIHGAYEWNTVLLAYELIDYLDDNQSEIPGNLTVTVIPLLNPDGLYKIVGTAGRFSVGDVPSLSETVPGRFNANNVDLNRNFDCNWQSTATWRDNDVNPGNEPFSEPESRTLRDYVTEHNPTAAVVYYSAAGGVYASSCGDPVMNETQQLMNTYANASGYPAEGSFDAYKITGDAVDWLAKQDIPAVSILLDTHTSIEWAKNQQGIEAVLEMYAQ